MGWGRSRWQRPTRPPATRAGVTHYTIDIGQFEDELHPDLPNPTRLWGYGQGWSDNNVIWTKHLGGIIAVQKGQPVQITFCNHLPPTTFYLWITV